MVNTPSVQVYFTMSSIHFSDTIYVYDGTDTSAPLLGAYNNFTNPVLALQAIEASLANASGCLTVRFVSGNSNEADGFHFVASCEHKCQEIIAALDVNLTSPAPDTNYIAVCPGTEIDFSADAAFPENDMLYHQSEATVTYEWVFGDGNTATGENVSHTYDEIGGYTVSLFVTDDQGCISDNSIETRVVIAGNPFSNSNPPNPICANDTLQMDFDMVGINGTVVEGTPFSQEITTTLGVTDTLSLPDGTGVCYESAVIFNCFQPGQTLDNPQDFINLTANLEHSFIGDLEISLICPNGQTLVLKSFTDPLGGTGYGGGTALGEPNEADDGVPGIGWNYSWTPITPVFDNMGAEAEGGMDPMTADSYEPYGTFYDLVGCPLNGLWTIEICDNWGADDGTIFGWEMTLNPDIAPDSWDYTVGIDQYSWTSGPYIIEQTNEAITVNPPATGFYDYNYNIIDQYGCSWDTLITLEVLPSPVVDLGQDITFCNGISSHLFNAMNPGHNYTWQDGSTNATYNATVAGDYSVTVTNGLCTDYDSVTVYPHTGFVVTDSFTDVSCFGGDNGTATVQATTDYPPYFYNWSDGQTGEQVDGLVIGDYYVTITDNIGCQTFDTLTISQPTQLESSHTSSIVSCFGGSDGELDLEVTGGSPDYTYLWNNGSTTQDIDGLSAQLYRVTITDSHDCILIHDVVISQADEIATDLIGDHYYCSEIEEILNSSATGGNAPYTYLWSTGETTESISISPTSDTKYFVTVTDSKDCDFANHVSISVYPELELIVSVQDEAVCPGESTILNINVEGGSGTPYTTSLNGSISAFPVILTPSDNDVYEVIVKDNCFHSADGSVTLYNHPVPEISFSSNVIEGCPPLEVQFNEANGDNTSQYLWEFTDGVNTPNTAIDQNPNHIFTRSGKYDVKLDVTNQFGCSSTFTKYQMIYTYPTPTAKFEADPLVTTMIDPNISFVNQSLGASTYMWDFGDGKTTDSEDPNNEYMNMGEYQAKLIAYSREGCSDVAEVTIKIAEEFTFYAPEAFTPDYDGKNETFKVFGNGIDNNQFLLQAYDRWGMLIFESTDMNTGWNGKVNNSNDVAQVGSYRWICVYKDTNGVEHEKTGSVALIR